MMSTRNVVMGIDIEENRVSTVRSIGAYHPDAVVVGGHVQMIVTVMGYEAKVEHFPTILMNMGAVEGEWSVCIFRSARTVRQGVDQGETSPTCRHRDRRGRRRVEA